MSHPLQLSAVDPGGPRARSRSGPEEASHGLSANTQAILLLTGPLLSGKRAAPPPPLSPGEYRRLARRLRELQHEPADLLAPASSTLLRACASVIQEDRLARLLGRGLLLSQVVDGWRARAIWVLSRADAPYPKRLKARLRDDAPPLLYGCGNIDLLGTGGLAVVGSRNVDEPLIDYARSIGRLTAAAGATLVSGGARGIDQAAMRGALEAGGKAIGVLADSLQRKVMDRTQRTLLLEGRLVLVSPYDPNAAFSVGHAMARNKLIYGLADASLVVNADLEKGGTWAGAVEQLDKLKFVPVHVRSSGEPSVGLDALRSKGAIDWPAPDDTASFHAVMTSADTTRKTAGSAVEEGRLFDAT